MIKVYSIGTKVILHDNIEAVIIGIQIRENNLISYECAWFNDGERYNAWFAECEITDIQKNKRHIKIGFKE